MKRTAAALAFALITGPGVAEAGIVPSLEGPPTPESGGFRYSYSAGLQTDQRLDAVSNPAGDHFFTIYDFVGFVPGTNQEPAGWTFSSANTGPTPPLVSPDDDPAIPNLTWTWTGAGSPILGPAELGTFSARSSIGPGIQASQFTSQATNNTGGPQDGTLIQNIASTSVPAPVAPGERLADPLGLISSGALIPYFSGSGGNLSFLEVSSPVGGNPNLHMIFFTANCQRVGESVGLPQTPNDVDVLFIDNVDFNIATSGLVAIAGVDQSGFNLEPLANPIHSRIFWVNVGADFIRILEPIGVVHAEVQATWIPLRTGATFWAPFQGFGFATTLYLVCPRTTVTAPGAFDSNVGFPPLAQLQPAGGPVPNSLRARIYDDDELFLRDVRTTCDCLTTLPVLSLSNVYANALFAANGTYTELESDPDLSDFAFTGYRLIAVGGPGGLEAFGRLSNGARSSLRGVLTSER